MDTDESELMRRLRGHVQQLAGEIGERNIYRIQALQSAMSYIASEWQAQGYPVEQIAYEISGLRCVNLEVTHIGDRYPKEILLIGAHYDSVIGSPGANDNASGVAALLEVSRLFSGIQTAMTVRFVAFVNEEPPFFLTGQQGSMVYARAARRRGDDIRLMASLETIGCYSSKPGSQSYPPLFSFFYPDRANFIGMVSDFRSRSSLRRLAAAFRAHSDFPLQTTATFRLIPGVSWSDHRSFWRQGYRALMITDTAFYRYQYYHTSGDTPDKVCYPELAQVTRGLFEAFAALANERLA